MASSYVQNQVRRDFAVTPKGQTHYMSAGAGMPVALLHERPLSSDEFREVLPLPPGYADELVQCSLYANLRVRPRWDSDPQERVTPGTIEKEGFRRVGKTSLASCTATKLGIRTVVIDARIESDFARGLVDGLSGYHTVNVGEVLRYVTCPFL